jgi:hypothetical protein
MSRFHLARCEVYHRKRHGPLDKECFPMKNRILCMESIEFKDLSDYIDNYLWKDIVYYILNTIPIDIIKQNLELSENRIRVNQNNWQNIYNNLSPLLHDPCYDKISIIEKIPTIDDNGEEWTTCVVKTVWISVIQRCWKNIFRKRVEIMKKRKNLYNLRYREIHGRWPNGMNHMPTISDIQLMV